MTKTDPMIAELTSREALPDGTNLLGDQFTITKRMSAGGFGITYRATDNALGRTVVLKECFSEHYCMRSGKTVVARSAEYEEQFRSVVKMFMREAQSLAKLRHPNIVGVHRVFEENGTAYMVLDLIEGNDLFDILDSSKEPLPPSLVIDILARLLDAIEKVHDCDLLHRDISPDNIIIDHDGNPVLIDFGAARGDASRRTRAISSLLVVKDGYSPKEFYTAGSIQTPSADLYALGATFYHVISGEAPIDSQLRMASVASYKPDPCEPLFGRFPEYDSEFLEAIDLAMQPLPADRLQSAAEWRTMISRSVTPVQLAKPDPTPLKQVLSQLIEETNEVVQKTRIIEAEQAEAKSKEPSAQTMAASQPKSVPSWVEEFNRETEEVKATPRNLTRVIGPDTETNILSGFDPAPYRSNPVPAQKPVTSDWISRAREKQTRMIEVDMAAYQIEPVKPTSLDVADKPITGPAQSQPQPEETPEFSQMIMPLLKYLSIGIAIGLCLMFIQLQFFT